jgi:hypothetical protein
MIKGDDDILKRFILICFKPPETDSKTTDVCHAFHLLCQMMKVSEEASKSHPIYEERSICNKEIYQAINIHLLKHLVQMSE